MKYTRREVFFIAFRLTSVNVLSNCFQVLKLLQIAMFAFMWCYVWKCPITKSAAPLYFIKCKNAVSNCSQLRNWKLKLCMIEPLTIFPNPPAINLVRKQLGVLSWKPLECVCNGDIFSLMHFSSSYILAFLFTWHFRYIPKYATRITCISQRMVFNHSRLISLRCVRCSREI